MEYYVTKNQKKLRCGITTGTCAAAAAKAAAATLLLGLQQECIAVHTPKGIIVEVPVNLSQKEENRVEYMVTKDSGDDPDVTNGAQIFVCVERLQPLGEECIQAGHKEIMQAGDLENGMLFQDETAPGLFLDGGMGIGRVTREGLEQKKGQAAINSVPRKMIFEAVREVCVFAEYTEKLLITVRVPQGKELAKRTFNPRLGIEGGISILGTSGIIEPMSEKAIVDTIETQIRQLQTLGRTKLLITPGNYGQSYAGEYLGLDMAESIKCSNYIGETFDLAAAYGMQKILLVGNIGKLVKLAAGIMNTHSRVADGRCEIFAIHTVLNGGSRELAGKIMECINTEEMLQLLEENGMRESVCISISRKIHEYIMHRVGDGIKAGVILFSESFGYLGKTAYAEEILQDMRKE